jgi:hypothetical protein
MFQYPRAKVIDHAPKNRVEQANCNLAVQFENVARHFRFVALAFCVVDGFQNS